MTGGSPYYVVIILDMMQAIKPDISTVALGITASSATLLLVRQPCSHQQAHNLAQMVFSGLPNM